MFTDGAGPGARFDLAALREERMLGGCGRELVARQVLAIVAWFADATTTCGQAMAGQVDCAAGESAALAAERQVRDLADRAEQEVRQVSGARLAGDIVCAVLAGEYLLDDYQRIRHVEQHLAFDDDDTEFEREARRRRWSQLADEARESATSRARLRRSDARLCRCGVDYGRHRRNLVRDVWVPADREVCRHFVDVETLPCSAVPRPVLEAAVRAAVTGASDRGGSAEAESTLRLLDELSAAAKGQTLTVGDALRTARNVLDW